MQAKINRAVQKHLEFIKKEYNLDIDLTISFDLKGRAAGQAIYFALEETFEVRFNLNAPLEFLLTDTVPHELAHILQAALGSKMDHGPAWEFYCKQLDGTGLIYHTNKELL